MIRPRSNNPSVLVSALTAAALALSACQTSPATGEKVISFNSRAEEKRIGAREHPNILKQFGGAYENTKVTRYISNLGGRLARASELPDIGWTFTVLNSKEVNAFAIPGGFVYVTRGLMALADNEAELAGVMSHEIGHVTALHSSRRQAGGTLAGLGSFAAALLLGRAGADLANTVGYASVQRYSQGQEFEADSLGVRYLSRTGYDTTAMAGFLTKMRASSRLENKKLKRPENSVDGYSIFASHPRTVERVERAVAEAKAAKSGTRLARVDYMEMLQGLLYGDDPNEGLVRGRTFVHPVLRFQFEVPDGFRLINSTREVIAPGPGGALIRFDLASKRYTGTLDNYIRNVWVKNARIGKVERINVNGMEGATAVTQARQPKGTFDVRLIAVRQSADRIYRFIFFTPTRLTRQLDLGLRKTTFSLRPISAGEAENVQPLRIRVRPVRAGDTVSSFVRQMALPDFQEETFRVLNGLGATDRVRTGQLVKVVTN